MASTPAEDTGIIGGVDTHQDLHTAAIVTLEGAVLGTESFSTTRAGYRAMLAWFRSHGELLRVGVESTGSYGAGIARHLALSGVPVLEVTGPDRAARRARGKDDALDAVAAAEAARTGCRVQVAKDRGGAVEALRVLRTTRKTAVKCRRAALQQLHNTIVAAPDELRDQVRNLTRMRRLRICAPAGSWTSTARSPNSTASSLRSSRNSHPICSSSKAWEPPVRASSWSPRARIPTGCAPKRASRCCAVPAHCPPRAVRRDATVSIAAGTARPTPPST